MAPMTPHEVLVQARKLIERPERWTKGNFAKDAHQYAVYPESHRAACWCAHGATIKASAEDWAKHASAIAALRNALTAGWARNIVSFNDDPSTTHADILALFDRAIESTRPHNE